MIQGGPAAVKGKYERKGSSGWHMVVFLRRKKRSVFFLKSLESLMKTTLRSQPIFAIW